MQLPAQKRQLLPYAIALLPPFVLQLFFKDLFFSALDYAGTYGVLVLFGVVPAAMTWQVNTACKMICSCCTLLQSGALLSAVGHL